MRFKLASYNIQKAIGLDLRRDPARVLAVIVELDADVVVLQEADKRLGTRPSAIPRFLIEQHSDYVPAEVAESNESLGWHGNAVLVRRDWQILETARLPLPSLEPRGAVMVRIAPTHRGRPAHAHEITVIGTHLGLLRTWRRRQVRALRDHAMLGNEPATVIAGDFNEWSMTNGLGPLHPDFQIATPGRTFPSARPIGPLDRAALGSGLRLLDSGVAQSRQARIASDHLPIWFEIELS